MKTQWYVYILQCADNSYYVGHTHDLRNRVNEHNAGEGASWTRNRRPITLLYSERHSDKKSALQREQQIKKWSRSKKAALIAGNIEKLKALSQRHNNS